MSIFLCASKHQAHFITRGTLHSTMYNPFMIRTSSAAFRSFFHLLRIGCMTWVRLKNNMRLYLDEKNILQNSYPLLHILYRSCSAAFGLHANLSAAYIEPAACIKKWSNQKPCAHVYIFIQNILLCSSAHGSCSQLFMRYSNYVACATSNNTS